MKPLSAHAVATAALLAMAEEMTHNPPRPDFGDRPLGWDNRVRESGPGTPGHGRPSVTRKKKAKTNGKNKRKRK